MESQITTPLERELTGLAGLEKLTSISQESAAVITAELVSGTDIDLAELEGIPVPVLYDLLLEARERWGRREARVLDQGVVNREVRCHRAHLR